MAQEHVHLGSVNKDTGGSVSTEPYFANQYDGRVHWGVEEGLMMTSTAYYRQIMKIVLGENYDGISLREALQIDAGFHGGSWSRRGDQLDCRAVGQHQYKRAGRATISSTCFSRSTSGAP